MFSMCVSTGMRSAAGGTPVHNPKSGGSRRTIQRRKRSRRLQKPPGGRSGKPVAVAVGELVPREHAGEISGDEASTNVSSAGPTRPPACSRRA